MNRRNFLLGSAAAIPLAALPRIEPKQDDDVITFRETGKTMERIEFEDLRIGDVAVFVSPATGPHKGRWRIESKPERFQPNSGRWTWLVRVAPA